MSPDDNPEEPHSDEGEEVISGPNRWSFSRRRAVILIVVSMIVVSALSATVAVTADRAVNGKATPAMVSVFLENGASSSESKAVGDGGDRLLSEERDLALYCPVSVYGSGTGYSTSNAAFNCGRVLGRKGCSVSWCDIYTTSYYYSYSRRKWVVNCACN
jgi:hypothetical protein